MNPNKRQEWRFYEYLYRGEYYPIIARSRKQVQAWLREKGISSYKVQEYLFARGRAMKGCWEIEGVVII